MADAGRPIHVQPDRLIEASTAVAEHMQTSARQPSAAAPHLSAAGAPVDAAASGAAAAMRAKMARMSAELAAKGPATQQAAAAAAASLQAQDAANSARLPSVPSLPSGGSGGSGVASGVRMLSTGLGMAPPPLSPGERPQPSPPPPAPPRSPLPFPFGPPPNTPPYTRSPLTDPVVTADPSVIARQAEKVAEARRALDAAQAKLDAAAKQDYTQNPGVGPGRDVTDPLSQAVFDARRTLTEQSKILDELDKSAVATGAAQPIPTPPLPPNANVQAFPPEPSIADQAAKGLTDASHDINKATFGLVPDVAKDLHTFDNWGEAGAGDRADALLDSASLVPGGKLLGEAHHGLDALADAGRHVDDLPNPHLDVPAPHADIPPPVDHHLDVFDPSQGLHYPSGDPHYPGGWPPDTPEATWSRGDADPGWHYVDRGPDRGWMPYQEQISGAERLPDGRIPEYAQVDPSTGNPVNFDGHTFRDGHEIFLDAKDGYSAIATNPGRPWTQGMEQSILNEVPRQLAALPPGATLEIHVSDPVGAAAIRSLLESNDLFGATVIFTPKAP